MGLYIGPLRRAGRWIADQWAKAARGAELETKFLGFERRRPDCGCG
jgi:hypothetical protein